MTREELVEVLAHELKHCRDKRGAPAAPVVFLKPTEAEALYHILTALTAPGEGLRPPTCPCCGNTETERAAWACAQCGYNALAAPAPQEQAEYPSCDGLLDTAGCTCPAPPAREDAKFPAPFEGCDHTAPERVEACWHAQLCPICATKNWHAAQRELKQRRSATPASAPEEDRT